MLKDRARRAGTLVFAVAAAAALVVSPAGAGGHDATAASLIVWADRPQKASLEKSAAAWAKAPVTVVVHNFGSIRDDLKTVRPESAPDIILGENDWLGDLAPSGTVLPLYLSSAAKRQFPRRALDAFTYGIALKRLYGAPYALENVGLVVDTNFVKVPRTFAQLEREALAFKRRKRGNIAIAVSQGAAGDAYYMYPFFSGLGGYVFGKNHIGLLDASNIGIANRTFLANSALIDRWNREGLVNSSFDYNAAKSAFLNKQAAFWITGPWESASLKASGLSFRIVQVPKIKLAAVPFLGVDGLMVTKFAASRGVDTLARNFVSSYMTTPRAQLELAYANGRMPANAKAAAKYHDPIGKPFGKAGAGGVPLPNIPQMSAVWTDFGLAWAKSTKGIGATRARVAFKNAARSIRQKIG